MSLSGEMLAFLILALMAVMGGLLLLYLQKVVHMVLAAVLLFISIAGLYVLLSAEFLAAVQILIYSGAITIMMLFGIMLTKHNDQDEKGNIIQKVCVFIGVLGFGVAVYLGIYKLDFPAQATDLHVENTRQIGVELFSKYAIPFELVSVLLLVALVGAVILARKDDEEEGEKQ